MSIILTKSLLIDSLVAKKFSICDELPRLEVFGFEQRKKASIETIEQIDHLLIQLDKSEDESFVLNPARPADTE